MQGLKIIKIKKQYINNLIGLKNKYKFLFSKKELPREIVQ